MSNKVTNPYAGIKDVDLLDCGYKIRRYIVYKQSHLDEIDIKDLRLGCNAYCIEDGETYYVTSEGWVKRTVK